MIPALFLCAVLFQDAEAAERAALAQCADCHPAEAASYADSGMARALGPLSPAEGRELAELAPVGEDATGFVYSFEAGGAGARIVEGRPGEGRERPYRDSAPLAFAIGAGVLDRSFVLERGGRWFLAPLEAVTGAAARHAALAPGHAMAPGTRFRQPVTPECLGCHTDAPPPRAWPLHRALEGWTPRGISCGACHGRLTEHVAFRAADLSGPANAGPDPIGAPARDAPERRSELELCAACHLQGDARIELVPGRLGPPPPGTELLATRAVFVARAPTDEIGFVSQVQRLLRSRCYLESADLRCTSCHDPHRALSAPGERARVRAACLACHAGAERSAAECVLAPEARAGKDCAACHLRRTGVFDVAEVEIHDHWIRRRIGPPSPARALRFPESATGDWEVFAWPDGPAPSFARDPGLWTLALAHGGHAERALAELARGAGEFAGKLPMLHHVRGSLLERAGRAAEARAEYERALALDPGLVETAINLGPLRARLGDPAGGRALLDRVLEAHPQADGALRNRAVVRLEQGDPAGCLADLERAQALAPDVTLAQTLARLAEQRGDAAAARRWTEEARRLDPRLP